VAGNHQRGQPPDHLRTNQRVIKRPRLTRLLDAAPSHVLTLIAPAGYGKTTLAREWIGSDERRGVWYRANEASSDLAALISGLARIIEPEVAGFAGEMLHALTAHSRPDEQVPHLAAMFTRSLRDWPQKLWLVIDDYQYLAASRSGEEFVGLLSEFERLNLLVTSRNRPSWVTPRRLLYGEIYELNRSALALTSDEAVLVVGPETRPDLPGLIALTEGWPAVIGLAAVAGELRMDREPQLPESLYEYFAEELFSGLDPKTQKALCELSLLPVVRQSDPPQLLGQSGQQVLARSEQAGFLTRDRDYGYELHPLLRAFLREKLAADHGALRTALGKVFPFLVDAARWDDAYSLINDYRLTDNFPALIASGLYPLLREGRIATVERWIAAAHEMRVRGPEVDLMEAEALFRTGNWDEAERLATRAAGILPSDSGLKARAFFRAGQSAQLADKYEAALRHHRAAHHVAASREDVREALWGMFVTECELEQLEDARRTLERFERMGVVGDEDELRLHMSRVTLAIRRGDLGAAVKPLASVRHLISRKCNPLVKCSFLNSLANGQILMARYRDALETATLQIEIARAYDVRFVLPHALAHSAGAHLGLKNMKNCEAVLRSAQTAVRDLDDFHTKVNINALRARMLLAQGRLHDALDFVPEPDWSREPGKGMKGEYLSTRAVALACAGKTRAAESLAARSEEASVQAEARVLAPCARTIGAMVDGHDPAGYAADVLSAVRATGNRDSLICAYRAYPQLLLALHDAGNRPSELEEVVCAGGDVALARKVGLHLDGGQHRQSLTPREQEVLELLHKGMTNRQIAQALWISETTAKVHIRHIFRKLNVHSRTQAVLEASKR
jgi:ATP/maltotriose-dependent transcriptional regulator MalT